MILKPRGRGRTMQHLFTPAGEAALARVLQQQPLLVFDFDGTLAPIVPRPCDARLSRAVSVRLAALAARLPVAVVSGRSVLDLRTRLGFAPRYILGNHGAEDGLDGAAPGLPAAAPEVLWGLRRRLLEHGTALAAAGVMVEDKGHSLALHYRLSRTRERALQAIGELLSPPDPAWRVFGGKLVVNVAPRHALDKAAAVRALVGRSGASCAIFVGDDINDEAVFAASPPGWLTIRVVRDDPRSSARFFLDSTAETAMLLQRMVALLPPS